jgi:hypothetical protein
MQELDVRFEVDVNGGYTEGGCIPDLFPFPYPWPFPLPYPNSSKQACEV